MKKSLLIKSVILTAGLLLTGCGNDTKLETGTYACSDDTGKAYKMVFDMENNTYDVLDVTGKSLLMGNPMMKEAMKHANLKMTVGPYNEKTQEYELKTKMEVFGMKQEDVILLKRNGDVFEMKTGTTIDKATCKKE